MRSRGKYGDRTSYRGKKWVIKEHPTLMMFHNSRWKIERRNLDWAIYLVQGLAENDSVVTRQSFHGCSRKRASWRILLLLLLFPITSIYENSRNYWIWISQQATRHFRSTKSRKKEQPLFNGVVVEKSLQSNYTNVQRENVANTYPYEIFWILEGRKQGFFQGRKLFSLPSNFV